MKNSKPEKNSNPNLRQLSLPLYLGKPFLKVKGQIRNSKARKEIEKIEGAGQELRQILNAGGIQSTEACMEIRNFLSILGIK